MAQTYAPESHAVETSSPPQTILVVDDEDELRELTCMSLSVAGYTTEAAEDGLSAIAKLEAGLRPHAILLDGHMPKLNGWGTLTRLKANEALRDIPVIFVSANGEADVVSKALSSGAAGYLVKPFPFEELVERLQEVLFEGTALAKQTSA